MTPPTVHLTGAISHVDFRDAIAAIHANARIVDVVRSPELIVVAQGRPGEVSLAEVCRLRRAAPLAGVVGLVGSWCEGEMRTGRPWPGVPRLYWYEFPPWWQRQLRLHAAGRCPDWARPAGTAPMPAPLPGATWPGPQASKCLAGVVVLHVGAGDTADVLIDAFGRAGFATVWQRPGRDACQISDVAAGVWDGGQLDGHELANLSRFCEQLARDRAGVVALLDFPRRHSVDAALACGAAAVLGKPWHNDDLVAAVRSIAATSKAISS